MKFNKILFLIMVFSFLILPNNKVMAKTYTCYYSSYQTLTKITMTNTGTEWNITVTNSNHSTETFTKNASDSMPSEDCEDIYYDSDKKEIKIANSGEANEDFDYLCSGKCSSNENDTSSSACPNELKPIIWFLKKVAFNTVQLLVPILLIVMGTIDFTKAVVASDEKDNKDAIQKFIKRCLAALIVFFIGTIVTIVMNMFAKTDIGKQNDWKACWQNID